MATNTRGRSGWTSRGRTTTTGKRNTYSRTRTSHTTTNRTQTAKMTAVPSKYKTVYDTFNTKINSYRTLYNQTRGPAKYSRPTPATLNTFANWINKGAVVQTCTRAQLMRWARMAHKNFNPQSCTTAACKNVLDAKFGKNTIKAVARTKSGSYMVATSPTWKGKTFNFPK